MVLDLHNYVLKLNALDYGIWLKLIYNKHLSLIERDRNIDNEINENNGLNETDNIVLETDNKAIGKIFIENE